MFRVRTALITLFFVFLCIASAHAQETPKTLMEKRSEIIDETWVDLKNQFLTQDLESSTGIPPWRLSVRGITRAVLENNQSIKISYLDTDSSKRSIFKEQSDFDVDLTLTSALTRTRTPDPAGGILSLGETFATSGGLEQKIFTGGTYSWTLNHNRNGRELRGYTSSAEFDLTQPIFKDFGPEITYARIHIAQNSFNTARLDLKVQIITAISNAQIAYWNILKAREDLAARELAHRQALDLLEQSKREMELGNRAYPDVLQAEATAASREEAVIVAQNLVKNSEDTLRQVIGVQDTGVWSQAIVVEDKLGEDFVLINMTTQECLKEAFKSRPDYQKALDALKTAEVNLMLAKNDLLPDLDLAYGLDFNGASNDEDSFRRTFRPGSHFSDWNVGVTWTVPWGRRLELAEYHDKSNVVKRQKIALTQLVLQIVKEVRAALRQVETNAQRAKTAKGAYELQAKKLEVEQKKFSLGSSSSFQVLEFQEDLVQANVARISAIVDYQQSVIQLWQALGTTLEKNDIVLEGE